MEKDQQQERLLLIDQIILSIELKNLQYLESNHHSNQIIRKKKLPAI
jgi:hypothetical protein